MVSNLTLFCFDSDAGVDLFLGRPGLAGTEASGVVVEDLRGLPRPRVLLELVAAVCEVLGDVVAVRVAEVLERCIRFEDRDGLSL